MMKTKRDPDGTMYLETLGILRAARNLRLTRRAEIDTAVERYGWTGPIISGCEQDHWPEEVKDRLRTNAREIGQAISDAAKVWRDSGRRITTLRALLPGYRVDGIRY
jgi:hypothetical protein